MNIKTLTLILIYLSVCINACSKREPQQNTENPAKNKHLELNTLSSENSSSFSRKISNTNIPDAGILHRLVTSNTFNFENALLHESTLRSILTIDNTNNITFAAISNKVAGISSKEILDFIIPSGVSIEFNTPQTYAMAMLYEVVLSRPEPPWARLYALAELQKIYNRAGNFQVVPKEWSSRINKMMREATLSDNPNKSERNTYANIKCRLMRLSQPAEQLERIEELRKLHSEEVIHLNSQVYDGFVLFEAISLIELDRIDEARSILNIAYDKAQKKEVHPYVNFELHNGVEAYIKLHRDMTLLNRKLRKK